MRLPDEFISNSRYLNYEVLLLIIDTTAPHTAAITTVAMVSRRITVVSGSPIENLKKLL